MNRKEQKSSYSPDCIVIWTLFLHENYFHVKNSYMHSSELNGLISLLALSQGDNLTFLKDLQCVL